MIQWWQILLLTLYSAYQICDELTIVSSAGSPVFAGFITGLIMGDVTTGLFIGGSLQLFVLGVGTFGGASRIDATSGAVLATAFSVSQGIATDLAITTIAVPVAALLTYFDVLGRMTTTFFAHRIDAAIERFDYKAIERNYLLGALPWALSRALPVFFALAFGGAFVQTVVDLVKQYQWVADGLTLAGRMLPGLGFAILLRYLPVKRNLHYLAMGFGLTAMLTVLYSYVTGLGGAVAGIVGTLPKDVAEKIAFVNNFKGLSMIGISIVGIFLAVLHFKNSQKVAVAAPLHHQKVGKSKMTNSNYKLTKEDFNQINKRSLFTFQLGWNYERMQASGYLYMILPQLRKMYGDGTPELKEMMKVHTQFFNTSPFFHTIIACFDLAMEEKDGVGSKDAVNGIKTGLMGTFAPLGDTIFGSLVPAIMGSIAATMAIAGQPWGIFLWIAVAVVYDIFRWKQLEFAYKEGVNLINNMQSTLTALIDAASVLGVFMMGALVATMINFEVSYKLPIGEKMIDFQDILNSIFPRLLPAIFTAFIFWLLGKKGMNSTKAIGIIIALAVGLSFIGKFLLGMGA